MGILASGAPLTVEYVLISESLIAALLVYSFVLARRHKGRLHHYAMIAAFLIDEIGVKPIMISRAFGGSFGQFPWGGTAVLPHLLLSIAMSVLGIAVIYLGFKRVVRKGKNMFLPPKGRLHRLLGDAFLISWAAAYSVGLWLFVSLWL